MQNKAKLFLIYSSSRFKTLKGEASASHDKQLSQTVTLLSILKGISPLCPEKLHDTGLPSCWALLPMHDKLGGEL